MKTIYVDRDTSVEYGFNKVLDEVKKHQKKGETLLIDDTFAGLYFKPEFNKTIKENSKYYNFIIIDNFKENSFCDIYIFNDLKKINNKSFLKIFIADDDYDSADLIPYKNIYVVRNWDEIDAILNFYKDYDIRTLKEERE